MSEKYHITPEKAPQIRKWLKSRGGIAHWTSVDLSCLEKSWSTPALKEDGTPMTRPHWQAASEPFGITTDPAEVIVDVAREVRRFRVAVRMGAQGFKVKLTDASTRKLRASCAAAAKKSASGQSWYEFDYTTQEAVIFIADREVPLPEWQDPIEEDQTNGQAVS